MATYLNTNGTSETFDLTERYIYGSSRVGVYKEPVSMLATPGNPAFHYVRPGYRQYELSNHLGNVTTTITAQKVPLYSGTTITGFAPQIVKSFDYSPFGVTRVDFDVTARLGGSFEVEDGVRYGFQGQEKDDEIKGAGNSVNYKYRMHDPRLGRFFALDPIASDYPWNSPYAFSENRVIDGVELEGLEYVTFNIFVQDGKVIAIKMIEDHELKSNFNKGPGKQYNRIFKSDDGKIERIETDFRPNGKFDYGNYQGGNNIKLPKIGGDPYEVFDDYTANPINEPDADAKLHDQRYDSQGAAGKLDAFFNRNTIGADDQLIEKSNDYMERHKKKEDDRITGEPITEEAAKAAKNARDFFSIIRTSTKRDKEESYPQNHE